MKKFDAVFNRVAITEADDESSADENGTPGDPFNGKGGSWPNKSTPEGEDSVENSGDEPAIADESNPATEGTPTEAMSIETKEDVQAVISSVKALWKYGVANDSLSVQKLVEPKDWQKFAAENGFVW